MPLLSTVATPRYEMAQRGGNHARDRARLRGTAKAPQIDLGFRVVERESARWLSGAK